MKSILWMMLLTWFTSLALGGCSMQNPFKDKSASGGAKTTSGDQVGIQSNGEDRPSEQSETIPGYTVACPIIREDSLNLTMACSLASGDPLIKVDTSSFIVSDWQINIVDSDIQTAVYPLPDGEPFHILVDIKGTDSSNFSSLVKSELIRYQYQQSAESSLVDIESTIGEATQKTFFYEEDGVLKGADDLLVTPEFEDRISVIRL